MPRSFNLDIKSRARDPKQLVRLGLGILLALNLAAAWFVYRTPGGTSEELENDMVTVRKQLAARQQALERLRKIATKVEKARAEGDKFLGSHFLARRNAYSRLEVDLGDAAKAAGIKARERTYNYEPIEGSDSLGMLSINANFEGTYADLINFVNQVDRSKSLLIIEQLQAQPQQGTSVLTVNIRLNAFFRAGEDEPPPAPATQEAAR
jgi:Tfp pilus assembly protein PilO